MARMLPYLLICALAFYPATSASSGWTGRYSSFPHLRLSKATQCYSDDECPRRQKCNDGKCENAPSTPEPAEPGCCAGEDKKSTKRCSVASEQGHCEHLSSSCHWIVTYDPSDCEEPTTTVAPGCCGAESKRNLDRCLSATTEPHCDRMSQCTWYPGEYADCTWTTTVEPGCCAGNTYQAASHCAISNDETHCGRMNGCHWIATDDPTDCEMTTTEAPGCCAGSARRFAERCAGSESKTHCDRMSSCHWIAGEDADCTWTTTTTEEPEPGCCVISDKRSRAIEGGWTERCTTYESDEMCTRPTSQDGLDRCEWVEVQYGFDCADLVTTTTEDPGCCAGSTARVASRCNQGTSEQHCSRMSECYWITGEDADCEYIVTTEEVLPGCCTGNSYKAFSGCNEIETENECERRNMCHWMETEDPEDCAITTSTTTIEPGCCSGSEGCVDVESEALCDRKVRCQWIKTYDASDCEVTTSTEAPGCCTGSDFERCNAETIDVRCEKMVGCDWMAGKDAVCDPDDYKTSGCCTGNSDKSQEMCVAVEDQLTCERKNKCNWLETADPMDCVTVMTTSSSTTTPAWTTSTSTSTTSANWMAAKPEEEEQEEKELSKKQKAVQAKAAAKGQQEEEQEVEMEEEKTESMLFGERIVVGEGIQEGTVSLSTVFVLMMAAFALQYVYKWWRRKKAMGNSSTIRQTDTEMTGVTGYYQQSN